MYLINTDTGEYPVDLSEFKRRINVSFGADLDPRKYGYAFVLPTPPPPNQPFHAVVEAPPANINNNWIQQWSVVPLDGAELEEAERIAQETAAMNAYIQAKNTAIGDNLPSWDSVQGAIDGIGNLEEAKTFLKKLSRVVYLLAKRQAD